MVDSLRRLIYRVDRLDNIEKDKFYWSLLCKGCGQPIHLFYDKNNGANRIHHTSGEEALLSAPCQVCPVDEIYEFSTLTPVQAKTDIQYRAARRKPSNTPRQPLHKRYPKAKPSVDPGYLEDRPEAAALIAECIARWTQVETDLARLLAVLLRANTEPAIAVFLILRSGRLQSEALSAAAQVVLDAEAYELFSAIMNVRQAVEKERNHLAHGQYGGAPQVKEGVLWIDPTHFTQWAVKMAAAGGMTTAEDWEWLRQRTFVYEPADIVSISKQIEELSAIIGKFVALLLNPDAQQRERLYRQLCALPPLRRELSRLRADQKKNRKHK
jgi:hypothetical protein